ncbi:MAG TPA: G5 domain-containing protein [Patescibacteria group bacterium]|nr:G5 domain-containing protein [Patescibacteria group bacterium]
MLTIFFFFLVWLGIRGHQNSAQVLGAQISAKPIIIIDNGVESQYFVTESRLAEIYDEIGLKIYPEDRVTVLVDPQLGLGTQIRIRRATAIWVNDGGIPKIFRTWKETVGQLLDEKQIKIGQLDRLTPSLETTLTDNLKVVIVRVKQKEQTEMVSIAFETNYKNDASLYIGQNRVERSGANGKKEVLFRLTFENNQLVSKDSIKEKIITEPTTKIVLRGTRKKVTVRCAGYNLLAEDAAAKNNIDPNSLCRTMMAESNGHSDSYNPAGPYYGLFQYAYSTWQLLSPKADFAGASISNARAQIYVTAWAWAHGYRGRWP